MMDDTIGIDELKAAITTIRESRAHDHAAHLDECRTLRDAIERSQQQIHIVLNNNHHNHARGIMMSQRDYKRIMENVYGGLTHAPPRYVLEQQAMLLQLSHRIGILQNELERRKVYKIKLEQYMNCEKSVLRSESEEVLAELQDIAAVSHNETIHRSMPARNETMLDMNESNGNTNGSRLRGGFFRHLSPNSIFTGSLAKVKNISPQSLHDAAAPSAPPLYSPTELANE